MPHALRRDRESNPETVAGHGLANRCATITRPLQEWRKTRDLNPQAFRRRFSRPLTYH